jgi:thioester reductase-like protein
LLLQDGDGQRLEAFLGSLAEDDRARVEPLTGHVSRMDLGLTSEAYRRLAQDLTAIHHLASTYADPGKGQPERLRLVNVQGTREIVELAGQCQALVRLVHWSTIHVSGCRQGVVMEEDLECGQRFHSVWEQTRYEAERLVRRASRKLSATVLRPGVVVGDSRTGELEAYDGPWRILGRFLQAPQGQPALLPGSGQAPVHLVPVDFVARAGAFLGAAPEAAGKTFHLVDPSPLSAAEVYKLVARKAHRRPRPQAVPKALTRLLRLHPRMERLARLPVAPPEIFDQLVFYNPQNALSLLWDAGIRCPSFPSYAERLVTHTKGSSASVPAEEDGPSDPLA